MIPEFPSALYYLPPPPPTDTLRSMPFIAHQLPHMNPPAMFLPPADHQRFMLVKQIEYYFRCYKSLYGYDFLVQFNIYVLTCLRL